MPMTYDLSVIGDDAIPTAAEPVWQHALDTYASETNKTFSVWRSFAPTDMNFRPHPRSSSIGEILQHQLLSERRFFAEFLETPEPAAAAVLPEEKTPQSFASRLVELASPRLAFLASQSTPWWLTETAFFDVRRQRVWVFWRRVLHSAHHRTQLTVYQRLIGATVLPTYGPTADVTWSGADPTLTVDAAARK